MVSSSKGLVNFNMCYHLHGRCSLWRTWCCVFESYYLFLKKKRKKRNRKTAVVKCHISHTMPFSQLFLILTLQVNKKQWSSFKYCLFQSVEWCKHQDGNEESFCQISNPYHLFVINNLIFCLARQSFPSLNASIAFEFVFNYKSNCRLGNPKSFQQVTRVSFSVFQ